MKIALGTLQDEYALSGEFQAFSGWVDRLRSASFSLRVFSPVGEKLRAQVFEPSRFGEKLVVKSFESWAFIRQAVRIAREVEVVHLFLPTPSFFWMADRVKKLSGKPIVVTCFGENPEGDGRQVLAYLRTSLRFYGVRYLVAALMPNSKFTCDRYIVGSQQIARQLLASKCPESRIHVLPPILPAEQAEDELTQELAREMDQYPTFLYVGHFLPNKGVEVVLEAFARMQRRESRLVLVWSGFGDLAGVRFQIEKLGIAARVRLITRPVNRSMLFIKACSLIMPYRASIAQVSPPILLLEAFKTGVPLLVSQIPVISEWAEDGRHAWFIDPADPAGIARKMDQLTTRTGESEAMRRAQRERYAERMDSIDIASAYTSLQGVSLG